MSFSYREVHLESALAAGDGSVRGNYTQNAR